MDNIDSELQALADTRDAAIAEPAAEPDVDAAAVAENAIDAAVSDDDKAATDAETADEPVEEEEGEEAGTDDTADTAEEASDDSFDDLLQEIPSNETILNAHKRIPQATKDALVEYASLARDANAKIDALGGDTGVELLSPLANVLTKAEITEHDSYAAIAPLIVANSTGTVEMLKWASKNILFNTDPNFKPMAHEGDEVLQNRFGTGYTAERIDKLVKLEQSGYIDANADFETLQAAGVDNELFQSQQATLAEQTARITELENLVNNPHLIERKTAQQVNAQKDLETELSRAVSQSVTPFRERGRWGEQSPLTQVVTENILNVLKNTPEYKEAAHFVAQFGSLKQGDVIPHAIQVKLNTLTNMAKGKFGEMVRAINAERRSMDERSSNVAIKEKAKETVPTAQPMVSQDHYASGIPLHSGVAQLQAIRDAAIAGAR